MMLFVSQGWGLMAATLSAVKLVAVFSHPEGTFLRRNLFATLGASSVAFAYIINSHESYFNEQDPRRWASPSSSRSRASCCSTMLSCVHAPSKRSSEAREGE